MHFRRQVLISTRQRAAKDAVKLKKRMKLKELRENDGENFILTYVIISGITGWTAALLLMCTTVTK